ARRRAAGPRAAHRHVGDYLDALEELLHGGRTRVRGPAAESGVDRSGESALDTGRAGLRRGQAEPGQPRAGRGTSDPGGARQVRCRRESATSANAITATGAAATGIGAASPARGTHASSSLETSRSSGNS